MQENNLIERSKLLDKEKYRLQKAVLLIKDKRRDVFVKTFTGELPKENEDQLLREYEALK